MTEVATPKLSPRPSRLTASAPPALDFFAGSGLVTLGLEPYFRTAWANDNCEKKAAVFAANRTRPELDRRRVQDVVGSDLPPATLAWASFPCQDLSLAGNLDGIDGSRSGLAWAWLHVLDGMAQRPPILAAENVEGLVSADGGEHYRSLHLELVKRQFRVGAVLLDAVHWLPHSRPRVFVVAVASDVPSENLSAEGPTWAHPDSVVSAAKGLPDWVWWRIPRPKTRRVELESIVEFDAPCDSASVSARNLALLSDRHRRKLREAIDSGQRVFPGYKRTRNGRQFLELRFDGIAGCLRTPEGGSSRQTLLIVRGREIRTRLLTVRETARLMGASAWKLPGSYNDGYAAMGDAVAVPVVRHLARHLLRPLADGARKQ
jgi:DNA (cytosine-5)-methyltransferase 1